MFKFLTGLFAKKKATNKIPPKPRYGNIGGNSSSAYSSYTRSSAMDDYNSSNMYNYDTPAYDSGNNHHTDFGGGSGGGAGATGGWDSSHDSYSGHSSYDNHSSYDSGSSSYDSGSSCDSSSSSSFD